MCRPAYTTGLLSEIQRELFTREIDNEALQDLVDYLREFPYVPSSKEPPAMKAVQTSIANDCYESLTSFVNYASLPVGFTAVPGGWAIQPNTLVDIKAVAKKEQETMYTPEQKKSEYLDYRLSNINCEKDHALLKEFHISDDNTPETPKEIVERILAGKYVLPKDEDQDYWSGENAFNNITWRDPSVAKDNAGYDAAINLKSKAYTSAKDQIVVGTPAEGLKALQDFESATFH